MTQKLFRVIVFMLCLVGYTPPMNATQLNNLQNRTPGKPFVYRYGLTDLAGSEIVPCKFKEIVYCGNGLFQMIGDELSDVQFYTKDGIKLKVSPPKGCFITDLISVGSEADANPNLELKQLPKESKFRFATELGSIGLCDKQGRLVEPFDFANLIPTTAVRLEHVNGRYGWSQRLERINSDDAYLDRSIKAMSLHSHSKREYVPEANPALKQKNVIYQKISSDRLRAALNLEIETFVTKYWIQSGSLEMFNLFLKEHNLIGMSEKRLFDFLGEGSKRESDGYGPELRSVCFPVHIPACLSGNSEIKVFFRNSVVSAWKFTTNDRDSTLFTSNVVMLLGDPKWVFKSQFPRTQKK